jgi:hypothetical protein
MDLLWSVLSSCWLSLQVPPYTKLMSSYSAVVFLCTVPERLRQAASAEFDAQVPAWLPGELTLFEGKSLFADLAH